MALGCPEVDLRKKSDQTFLLLCLWSPQSCRSDTLFR